eukprot:m.104024 g.104024  ORF g.104024 m.104024 type:complete len:232 (-) comp10505_c0_seq2:22-717(-)
MNEDGKVIPGPHHLADILRCKVEASQALATFQFARDTTDEGGAASDGSEHSPGQGRDRQRTAALTIHQTEQRYHGILSDIAQLRRDGGIFPCSFRAGQFADGDAIVVTRQGRFIMTQGHDLSVILPDELLAVTNKVARFRRGGYQRREAEHSYAFQISWVRVRPDQPPMPTRTQVWRCVYSLSLFGFFECVVVATETPHASRRTATATCGPYRPMLTETRCTLQLVSFVHR